jgi:hypothetical protein
MAFVKRNFLLYLRRGSLLDEDVYHLFLGERVIISILAEVHELFLLDHAVFVDVFSEPLLVGIIEV